MINSRWHTSRDAGFAVQFIQNNVNLLRIGKPPTSLRSDLLDH